MSSQITGLDCPNPGVVARHVTLSSDQVRGRRAARLTFGSAPPRNPGQRLAPWPALPAAASAAGRTTSIAVTCPPRAEPPTPSR